MAPRTPGLPPLRGFEGASLPASHLHPRGKWRRFIGQGWAAALSWLPISSSHFDPPPKPRARPPLFIGQGPFRHAFNPLQSRLPSLRPFPWLTVSRVRVFLQAGARAHAKSWRRPIQTAQSAAASTPRGTPCSRLGVFSRLVLLGRLLGRREPSLDSLPRQLGSNFCRYFKRSRESALAANQRAR